MNNYVLNCKSHFLAMFHGCAAPEERRRKGRSLQKRSHFHWPNQSLAPEGWSEPIRKEWDR